MTIVIDPVVVFVLVVMALAARTGTTPQQGISGKGTVDLKRVRPPTGPSGIQRGRR